MTTLTILFAGLLVLPAQRRDDPEPPKPGPIGVRLVAKKAKYTLDFGGKKEDYVRLAKAGKVEPPRVEMELVITNHTRGVIRIRSGATANRLTLTLKGNGALAVDANEFLVRPPLGDALLKPGGKLIVPIDRLSNASYTTKKGKAIRQTKSYWTEPGEHSVSASFYTLVTTDYKGRSERVEYQTLTSKPITIEVEK